MVYFDTTRIILPALDIYMKKKPVLLWDGSKLTLILENRGKIVIKLEVLGLLSLFYSLAVVNTKFDYSENKNGSIKNRLY